MKQYPSQETLRKILDYDASTGVFRWKPGRQRAGKVAGSLSVLGYIVITIGDVAYMAHVLAWIYANGGRPEVVDHKDGNRGYNALANLREANRALNRVNSNGNRGARFPKGVRKDPRCRNRFQAYIANGGKEKHLGMFGSAEDAHQAYLVAARAVYGDFVRS